MTPDLNDDSENGKQPNHDHFPVVGIGASAGGLEAFDRFFMNMAPDSGMAFVVVQHLSPSYESILANLLAHYTRMPVTQVEDGVKVEPNHVYVIPPGCDLDLHNGNLMLSIPAEPRGHHLPIDHFFRSLARDQHERAICIVLSGGGSDGTVGINAVKEAGGMTMAQTPETASHSGMPESAIATGLIDFVLSPAEMPQALLRYTNMAVVPADSDSAANPRPSLKTLQKIYSLLQRRTGHDFSDYKSGTMNRRIERRMVVNRVDNLQAYLSFLQYTPSEVDTLFKELLIGVTRFFRDPDAFASLRDQVLPRLFANHTPGVPIRVWVPGCSTGEEAYSIAILFHEYAGQHRTLVECQIFATDVDPVAIEKARLGVYPTSIAADLAPRFLERHFINENGNYRISQHIRKLVTFAEQSVTKDPPFAQMDLVSCRNVLIYLNTNLQNEVIPLFHYALNPNGFLFLGTSGTLNRFDHLFQPVDRKWKIFKRQHVVSLPRSTVSPALPDRQDDIARDDASPPQKSADLPHQPPMPPSVSPGANARQQADRDTTDASARRILELEQELRTTREYLQATIEMLETSNEALKNTNESLETVKEELESVNEELIAVNSELNSKVAELAKAITDQMNMLQRINVGLIFLNLRLQLRLCNSAAVELLNVGSEGIGRTMVSLAETFEYANFADDCDHVLNTLKSVSQDIRTIDGDWYCMEIHPYRTAEGDVDGLIVTFANITDHRLMVAELARSEMIYRTIALNLPGVAVFVFDHDLRYLFAGGEALIQADFDPLSLVGKSLYEVLPQERAARQEDLYRAALNGEHRRVVREITGRRYELKTYPVRTEDGEILAGMLISHEVPAGEVDEA